MHIDLVYFWLCIFAWFKFFEVCFELFIFAAKRGGDYYMYECESDNEEDILELEPPKDSLAPEISPDGDSSGIGPIQVRRWEILKLRFFVLLLTFLRFIF